MPQKELGKKRPWPVGLGSLYRVPVSPKLAVLCHFPALPLPWWKGEVSRVAGQAAELSRA